MNANLSTDAAIVEVLKYHIAIQQAVDSITPLSQR
jgi:hypothetical protein